MPPKIHPRRAIIYMWHGYCAIMMALLWNHVWNSHFVHMIGPGFRYHFRRAFSSVIEISDTESLQACIVELANLIMLRVCLGLSIHESHQVTIGFFIDSKRISMAPRMDSVRPQSRYRHVVDIRCLDVGLLPTRESSFPRN